MSGNRTWAGKGFLMAWARWRIYVLKTKDQPMHVNFGESLAKYTEDPAEREELAVMSFVHQTMREQSRTLEDVAMVTVDVSGDITLDFKKI